MNYLKFSLFSRFTVQVDDEIETSIEGQKVQELLCFLLLHQDRPHTREELSTLLWEDSSSVRAKQYLRQTLWQLQSVLEEKCHTNISLFSIDSEWIYINSAISFWSDVKEFEQAYHLAKGKRGYSLDAEAAATLKYAVELYRGDLLVNWYQDWCILERERFQNMYLIMIDKLLSYSESNQEYEQGIYYGVGVLRCDIARERTHRRLMRLRYKAGDRSGALRQYERCVTALQQEFGVEPSHRTQVLYQQIKADNLSELIPNNSNGNPPPVSLSQLFSRIDRVRTSLIEVEHQLHNDIEAIRLSLTDHY